MKVFKVSKESVITDRNDNINRYFNDIKKFKSLSIEDETDLVIKYQKENDQNAIDQLILNNLRFVISVAKMYQGLMPLEDLINEGNLGLIIAAKKFDPTRGFKFISYAVWWIKNTIHVALHNHSNHIRIPSSIYLKIRKLEETIKTDEDLLNIDRNDYIKFYQYNFMHTSYLYDETSSDNLCVLDTLIDTNYIPVDNNLILNDNKLLLLNVINALSEREKIIIINYYGLNGKEGKTYWEIGKLLDVSGETIRITLNNILRKLKYRFKVNSIKITDFTNN